MGEPVRVLHVLGGLSLGGAESRIMDLYRCMDREKVQFDFLVHQSVPWESRTLLPFSSIASCSARGSPANSEKRFNGKTPPFFCV